MILFRLRSLGLSGLLTIACLTGCVEGPQSDEFASLESVDIEADPQDSVATAASTSSEVAQADSETSTADDGWKAVPKSEFASGIPKPSADNFAANNDIPTGEAKHSGGAAEPVSGAVAALAAAADFEPQKAPSLIPGGLNPAPSVESVPAPFPVETPLAAQTPEPVQTPASVPEPAKEVAVSPSRPDPVPALPEPVKPAPEAPAEATPEEPLALTTFDPPRPRSLIVISPKKLDPVPATQAPPAAIPTKPTSTVESPTTTAADPAQLAKVDLSNMPKPGVAPPAVAATTPSQEPSTEILPPQPVAPPEGFIAMLNGQDLTGWSVYDGKSESWKFVDGAASCVSPGGGWLQSDQLYSDFELRFEYRLPPGGNSGVSLRFPGTGNPSLDGLEIQLLDDRAEKYQNIQPEQASGSLYFAVAPKDREATHPAGEWNQCTLVCAGSHLRVTINDKLVNEIDLDQLTKNSQGTPLKVSALRSPVGSIALQSHVSKIDFRNIYLKDLTQALASGVRWLDLEQGTGAEVTPGSTVTVHYIGHLKTGKKFASSVDKDKPATVTLKDVIPGWREGIPGMKVGGKRRLIVPPELGYGVKGFKEVIPPNSTLVYEIELLRVENPIAPPSVQSAQAGSDSKPQ